MGPTTAAATVVEPGRAGWGWGTGPVARRGSLASDSGDEDEDLSFLSSPPAAEGGQPQHPERPGANAKRLQIAAALVEDAFNGIRGSLARAKRPRLQRLANDTWPLMQSVLAVYLFVPSFFERCADEKVPPQPHPLAGRLPACLRQTGEHAGVPLPSL